MYHRPDMRSAVALSIALPFVLSACGGGNSSSSETPGPTIDLQQAHADAEVQTISITGWSGSPSNTFTGTRTKTLSPATDISLNGQPALRRKVTYVDKISNSSGAVEFDFAETIDANTSTHAIIDVAETGGSNVAPAYTVYEGYVPPAAVVAGQGGYLMGGTRYTDNTLATPQNHFTTEYLAAADTDSSLLVTYTTRTYDNTDVLRFVSVVVERVSISGAAASVSSTTTGYGPDGHTVTSNYAYTPLSTPSASPKQGHAQ